MAKCRYVCVREDISVTHGWHLHKASHGCNDSTNPWFHDDVIKWTHFLRYWPVVREIHWSPVNYTRKGQWRRALMFSLNSALNKCLSKQSWGWWFQTPTRSLWRNCNVKLRTHDNAYCDNKSTWRTGGFPSLMTGNAKLWRVTGDLGHLNAKWCDVTITQK